MSFNRENVTWQSADGTWALGFYRVIDTGNWGDDDYDPEWDVEYDQSEFEWVSTGHPSERAAHDSWDGANPGGGWIVAYDPDLAGYSGSPDHLDDMAAVAYEGSRSSSAPSGSSWPVRSFYQGPPRQRTTAAIEKELGRIDKQVESNEKQMRSARARGQNLIFGGHDELLERQSQLRAKIATKAKPPASPHSSGGAQGRVQAGIPAGGQFAAKSNPESNIELSD